jgi:protein-tyrosine phosphatase
MKEGPAANIIDTHSHALPGVDHGSPDLETTLRMIGEASLRGTSTIVCTPHLYEPDMRLVARAREAHREVVAALKEQAIPVRLLLGFEVDLSVVATSDLDTIRSICINGADAGEGAGSSETSGTAEPSGTAETSSAAESPGRAVLIEMPYSGWPLFLEQTLFRLTAAGFLPILAHPERNERVRRSPDALAACLNAGAVAQGTAGSLSSMFRKQSMKTFHELLARGWFSLLASDAHSQPDYTWSLAPLLTELGKRLSAADRELLTEVNPARVLEGKSPIPLVPKRPIDGGRRRFL